MSTAGLTASLLVLAHVGSPAAEATPRDVPDAVRAVLDELADEDAPSTDAPRPTVDLVPRLSLQSPEAPAEEPIPLAPPEPASTAPAPGTSPPVWYQPTPIAGYFPGQGFVLRSTDENFLLRLRLTSGIRGQVYFDDGRASTVSPFFTIRPSLSGNIYRRWIRYWTSFEFAADPAYLLDSYVEVEPVPAFGIRVGQQPTPFARQEFLHGPESLLLPDWNAAASYFWSGRDKGVTVYGAPSGRFEWYLGAYLGIPLRRFTPIRGNYLFVARVALNPLGPLANTELAYTMPDVPVRYSFGFSAYSAKQDRAEENVNPSTFTFAAALGGRRSVNHTASLDFMLQTPRFTALAEGYVRRNDARDQSPAYAQAGAFAQAGLLVYERDLDVSVRGTWTDVNLDLDNTRTLSGEIATSYYIHAPMLALKLRYAYVNQRGVGNDVMAGPAELVMPPGDFHILTLQLNAAF